MLSRVFRLFTSDKSRDNPKYWLFYAGTENYLCDKGVREFPDKLFWSCEPETKKGDLIVLYRKSMNQISVKSLIKSFNMTSNVATEIKKMGLGKDISAIWRAESDSRRQNDWHWPYGCDVQQIKVLCPALKLDELKSIPELRRWESFRLGFQSSGHSALEIPPFAWHLLSDTIEKKYGFRISEAIGSWALGAPQPREKCYEQSKNFAGMDQTQPLKTYSVDDIRQEHPKAYEKWAEDEDALLLQKSREGMSVEELSRLFQRKEGAIFSRLRKLNMVEKGKGRGEHL